MGYIRLLEESKKSAKLKLYGILIGCFDVAHFSLCFLVFLTVENQSLEDPNGSESRTFFLEGELLKRVDS